jgi:hypothetical protein
MSNGSRSAANPAPPRAVVTYSEQLLHLLLLSEQTLLYTGRIKELVLKMLW